MSKKKTNVFRTLNEKIEAIEQNTKYLRVIDYELLYQLNRLNDNLETFLSEVLERGIKWRVK